MKLTWHVPLWPGQQDGSTDVPSPSMATGRTAHPGTGSKGWAPTRGPEEGPGERDTEGHGATKGLAFADLTVSLTASVNLACCLLTSGVLFGFALHIPYILLVSCFCSLPRKELKLISESVNFKLLRIY